MTAIPSASYPARNRTTPHLYPAASSFSITPLRQRGLDRYGGEAPGTAQTFKILWIIRGKAHCRLDLQPVELGDNQLVCIRQGKISHLEPTEQTEGYMIGFGDNFLSMDDQEFDPNYQRGLSRIFSKSAIIPVRQEIRDDMKDIAERMQKEFENIFLYKDQILRRYLKIFLIYLSRHEAIPGAQPANSRGAELAREFVAMMEMNFKRVRSVANYAKSLAVTPNHLNVVVKEHTGRTAGHHVKHRLILEAKRLAVYSNLCMKEIADDLGFSDTAHFSKFFKNCSGMNFSEFKKEHLPFPLRQS